MVAAGLATAASPLLLGQQMAGAAVTSAHDEEPLTFVTTGLAFVPASASLRIGFASSGEPAVWLWNETPMGALTGWYVRLWSDR